MEKVDLQHCKNLVSHDQINLFCTIIVGVVKPCSVLLILKEQANRTSSQTKYLINLSCDNNALIVLHKYRGEYWPSDLGVISDERSGRYF